MDERRRVPLQESGIKLRSPMPTLENMAAPHVIFNCLVSRDRGSLPLPKLPPTCAILRYTWLLRELLAICIASNSPAFRAPLFAACRKITRASLRMPYANVSSRAALSKVHAAILFRVYLVHRLSIIFRTNGRWIRGFKRGRRNSSARLIESVIPLS